MKGFWQKGNPVGIALEIDGVMRSVGVWGEGEFKKWALVPEQIPSVMDDTDEDVVVNKVITMKNEISTKLKKN